MSRLDTYISRYGDSCANNDNNDEQPITLPLVHAHGVTICE